jgi:outer membrane protein assembly factor BamB
LLLYKDTLIIQLDHNGESGSALIALETATGKQRWRTRRHAGESFQTPIIAETSEGPQIVTATAGGMTGYDPQTGAELWSLPTGGTDDTPSPAYGRGIALSAHSGDSVYAVKTDARGKVKPLWTVAEPVEVASPLVLDDIAYIPFQDKIVALELATGKPLWEHEVDENAYASLVAVGDKIFFISQPGDVLVFQAGRQFKPLGQGKVGEGVNATPAIAGAKLFIRGLSHLFCFGTQ